jgi:hypothetical protein
MTELGNDRDDQHTVLAMEKITILHKTAPRRNDLGKAGKGTVQQKLTRVKSNMNQMVFLWF